MENIEYRGKQKACNVNWIYGQYFKTPITDESTNSEPSAGWYFLTGIERHCISQNGCVFEIDQETIGLFTTKTDKENHKLYSGDIIELLDGTIAEIKYGKYEMYCPYDEEFMINLGFYVKSPRLPLPMPLGPTEDYAIRLGNIYDNPEFLNNLCRTVKE